MDDYLDKYDDWLEAYYEQVYEWSDVSSTFHLEPDDGMDGWADTYGWILHLPEKEEE
jgi:hypothetical protein